MRLSKWTFNIQYCKQKDIAITRKLTYIDVKTAEIKALFRRPQVRIYTLIIFRVGLYGEITFNIILFS